MEKHRAAAASDPWSGVVVDLNNEVIKPVLAPKPVTWFIGHAAKWTVVATIPGVFAPSSVAFNAHDGQAGPRPWSAIGPPPDPQGAIAAGRGCAIAFPLIGQNASATQHHWNAAVGHGHNPVTSLAGPGPYPDYCQRFQSLAPHPSGPPDRIEITTAACSFTSECSTACNAANPTGMLQGEQHDVQRPQNPHCG
jgi:hypothetical protein